MEINQQELINSFGSSPGDDLVVKLMGQLAKVDGFVSLFGSYSSDTNEQRWADYERFDWSIRQLPTICVFEGDDENKESDNAFLNGNIKINIFLPPKLRRNAIRRFEVSLKGIFQNFFASEYATKMLDELFHITRSEKVYGLNELGRIITWHPNTEGIIETESVPVVHLTVNYKIDLRSWYRALEYMGRTKENPFSNTLDDLQLITGTHEGYNSDVKVEDRIPCSNP
jgi:hypothetical protein